MIAVGAAEIRLIGGGLMGALLKWVDLVVPKGESLYFPTREGVTLSELYKSGISTGLLTAREAVYVPSSRAFMGRCLSASKPHFGHVHHVQRTFRGDECTFLNGRLAFDSCALPDSDGLHNCSRPLSIPGDETRALELVEAAIDRRRNAFRSAAEEYIRFLGEMGVSHGSAFVDVGFSGSIATMTGMLLGSPLNAYLLVGLQASGLYWGSTRRSLLGPFSPLSQEPLVHDGMILESLCAAEFGRMLDFARDGGPVYAAETIDPQTVRAIREQVTLGAMDFWEAAATDNAGEVLRRAEALRAAFTIMSRRGACLAAERWVKFKGVQVEDTYSGYGTHGVLEVLW